MRIGRKEAILALVATVIPFMGRKGNAQIPRRAPVGTLRAPVDQAPDLADMQRRIAALEAQLANQVAFTKDSYGNLTLRSTQGLKIDVGTNLDVRASSNVTIRASSAGEFAAGGPTTIRGATIALN
jgi:hypothetical protein